MKSDPAGRGSLEARLDLLLGEEIQVNREFAQWFAAPALLGRAGGESLTGLTDPVVRFNIWDAGAPPLEACYAGENDLDVVLALADGSTARLLIEDKVWAPFQRDQALRYRKRADSRSPRAAAMLVAPGNRLDAANADAYFDKAWSIEEIAEFLETQGSVASEALRTPEVAQEAGQVVEDAAEASGAPTSLASQPAPGTVHPYKPLTQPGSPPDC